jgi:hypothetical protein
MRFTVDSFHLARKTRGGYSIQKVFSAHKPDRKIIDITG